MVTVTWDRLAVFTCSLLLLGYFLGVAMGYLWRGAEVYSLRRKLEKAENRNDRNLQDG